MQHDTAFDFAGKTTLVVGGTSGIGNGIAQAFRAAGSAVHVWGTRAAPGDYRTDEGSDLRGLHFSRVDVSDAAAVHAFAPPFDRLDVLVLAQGAVEYRRAEFEDATFRRVVDVNLNSVMACASVFHPLLKAAGGAVIVVSSISAYRAALGTPAYAASKAAALSLTRSLGAAWATDGIRVNGIAPGLVATKMTRVTTDNPQRLAATVARIPAGRVGTPADMAGVALFLASPLARYVIGHTIPVDGGLSA
ncbi:MULTISPECIES: SDR family NAD(P)-dependent oxidoreductase [unclassified Variovorax]|jgi:3-oxoacyl-[acyl-carrier protein] reductase|uniref:SDR family NAD(P)-dependent oxidoreductase n=1 Tax=unclassified Variovorax TaxID=663243 RepID=UPI000D12C99F|nr:MULTISPECIES: SDR family oxidoreductase [unclassified Variovorax]AVQ85412.1 3-oxoacyl-ACP reductase [Variovorax sp. PMC12]QRY35035.1 SDR family oxidoreductase [Variovorax sp. PDNC026]